MGSKNKLKRFRENETFFNVIQPERDSVLKGEFPYKGLWRKIFINKISHKLRLIVFDGGHEMLENAAFDAITSSINSN